MKKRQIRKWATPLLGCLLVFLLGNHPLQARESHENSQILDTIIVTAEKRKENIQDVPISVTTLSGAEIEDAEMTETQDFIMNIPNLYMGKLSALGSGSWLSMRGITTVPGDLSVSPAVGFFVDGAYYSGGLDTRLLDIERIEVLRGPQGTMYGRNTSAGVINLITTKPKNIWQSKASGRLGNYKSLTTTASVGGPLVQDKLFFRVAGSAFLSDGYVENITTKNDDVADRKDYNGRAMLRWTPSEQLDLNLSTELVRFRDGRDNWSPLEAPCISYADFEGYEETDSMGVTMRADHKASWFTLTSISSFRSWTDDHYSDVDFTAMDFIRFTTEQDFSTVTQEIRLVSPEGNGPLKWLTGIYYFNEDKEFDLTYHMRQGIPAYGVPPYQEIQRSDLGTRGYSIFGQGTYKLVDRLDLTLGLRYEHETKDLDYKRTYSRDLSSLGMVSLFRSPGEETYDELLPKVSASWKFTEDLMSYVSVAKGYKSGGFNIYSPAYVGNTYDPEYSWNYELGLKSSWLDNRLNLNLAMFYIRWEDQQVSQFVDSTNFLFKNAAKSESQGFEIEIAARPTPRWNITGSFGYTHGEFKEFTDDIYDSDITSPSFGKKIGEADYRGNKNWFAPEYTYHLGVQYRHPRGFFARTDLSGTGPYYYDQANSGKENGYVLISAKFGYETDRFGVYLWGKNLLDEDYTTAVLPNPLGKNGTTKWFGRSGNPRTYGITFTVRF